MSNAQQMYTERLDGEPDSDDVETQIEKWQPEHRSTATLQGVLTARQWEPRNNQWTIRGYWNAPTATGARVASYRLDPSVVWDTMFSLGAIVEIELEYRQHLEEWIVTEVRNLHDGGSSRIGAPDQSDDEPQSDPDVMGYLGERYGVEVEPIEHDSHPLDDRAADITYLVNLGVLQITYQWVNVHGPGWHPTIGYGFGSYGVAKCVGYGYETIPAACDAADEAVLELLEETREVLS